MTKCTIIGERLAPPEPPCENRGWPELGNVCREHFIKFDLERANQYRNDAEAYYQGMLEKLGLVEQQMGLRATPAPREIVLNSNPAKGQPIGWYSDGKGNWTPLPEIRIQDDDMEGME